MKRKPTKCNLTPEQLAEKWISELREAGYTYDDMLVLFADARRKYEAFKKRETERKSKNVPENHNS